MRAVSKMVRLTLIAAVAFVSGCGVVGVELTSSPSSVKPGDPVTFNIKLTNHSACPVDEAIAILIPFIPLSEFNDAFADIPPDAPPEIIQFVNELREFFDELCAGGTPTPPVPPVLLPDTEPRSEIEASCRLIDNVVRCVFAGRVSGEGSMSFPLLDGRLQCTVEGGFARCGFELPIGPLQPPDATTSAAVQNLTCLTAEQLGAQIGFPIGETELGALCFIGTFPMFEGLPGKGMAVGSVVLPAHGSGVVRNLVFVISPEADEVGVCKNNGEPCDPSDMFDCPGSSCATGICVAGTIGLGCNVDADCGVGGDCTQCTDTGADPILPLDCTTTNVAPSPAPVMSAWGLAALGAVLLATGTLWLQRKRARR